jgi:hypothetical protein
MHHVEHLSLRIREHPGVCIPNPVIFVLVALEFEFRLLCLLGKHATIQATTPVLFCFSYFSNRVICFLPVCLRLQSSDLSSCKAEITIKHYHSWLDLFWEIGSYFFCLVWASNYESPVSTSQIAEMTGVSHTHGIFCMEQYCSIRRACWLGLSLSCFYV